jgi:hypothetical protein
MVKPHWASRLEPPRRGGDNFRFFQYDILPAVGMYASQIKLADRQRERIEQIRRQYREELNRVVAAGRANWVPCHSLTKAPVHGRPLDLKQAAVCSRRAAELQYQAYAYPVDSEHSHG